MKHASVAQRVTKRRRHGTFCPRLLFSGEKNFHIFYSLYDGLASEGRLSEYFLHTHEQCRNHRYLQRVPDQADEQQTLRSFHQIVQSFQLLGFRSQVSPAQSSLLPALICSCSC